MKILNALFRIRGSSAALWALVALPAAGASATEPFDGIQLRVRGTAVYRVSQEELAEAGLPAGTTSDLLALETLGEPVPIWIEDGGDGTFDPGDTLSFVGEHLKGEASWFNEYSDLNVYTLRIAPERALRIEEIPLPAEMPETPPSRLVQRQHHEEDRLLLRFRQDPDDPPQEGWFWNRSTHIDKRPFTYELDLAHLADPASLVLRLELRGWSTQTTFRGEDAPDHRVEVLLNEYLAGAIEWNGDEVVVLEIDSVPRDVIVPGANELRVEVPKRFLEGQEDPIVDAILLNWIEVEYVHDGLVEGDQLLLRHTGVAAVSRVVASTPLEIYGRAGTLHQTRTTAAEGGSSVDFAVQAGAHDLIVVPVDGYAAVDSIEPLRHANLASATNRADYIIVTHPRLREAIEPLAEFRRDRGLEVMVVSVDDIYNEFHHGIIHPRAIRDFLSTAYHDWQRPAPRFVLLVGDASWDAKSDSPNDKRYADWTHMPRERARLLKNKSTSYEDDALAHRDLVPTWKFASAQGHAASDNYFVSLSGDDWEPDMAIGRLPVTTPEEVAAIVTKTIDYASQPEVGPWRRRILWITNENNTFQRRSDLLATSTAESGYASNKIYPSPEEASNEHHQEALLAELAEGQLLVHFLGHGGRYIWRTGPPDYRKNHDLFTLDHVEQLAPSRRLPVVLSMTCYSAPFDHPTADSIGEKFLRVADRGAVAVVAASWRNYPTPSFSESLVRELTAPGTIGEAVQRAKAGESRELTETYNLLGDPALEIAVPQRSIAVSVTTLDSGQLRVQGEVEGEQPIDGRAIVEVLDDAGQSLVEVTVDVIASQLEATLPDPRGDSGFPGNLAVYFWNEDLGIDGLGHVGLARATLTEEPTSPTTTASTSAERP